MTLQELKECGKDMLTPADVADVLGVKPYSINLQAKENIGQLGFSAALIGTRVLIPRLAFIRWVEGGV